MWNVRHEIDNIIDFEKEIRILSVEDSDDDFAKIRCIFDTIDKIQWKRAQTLEEATEILIRDDFDIVLLDYRLPDGNGLEFMATLQRNDVEVPVIAITGQGDEIIASKLIRAGAFDYIPKTIFQKRYFFRSIRSALEKSMLNKDMKKVQERLISMATRDELTGLYNRRIFYDTLKSEMGKEFTIRAQIDPLHHGYRPFQEG